MAGIRSVFAAEWADIEWCESRSAAHLADLCREAAAAGFARVIVGGGDGSIHYAVRALVDSNTALGILPLGTGNDFAAAAGMPMNVLAAARLLCESGVAKADLGAVNGIPFCCVAGIGMDTPALEYINRSRLPRGPMLYQLAAIGTLASYVPGEMSVLIDGEIIRSRFHFAAFCNTPTYAGGNPVVPRATIFDANLDYCLFSQSPVLRRLATFLQMKRGRHIGLPGVRDGVANSIRVESATPIPITLDGELTSIVTPAAITLLPGALRLICPQGNT